MSDNSRNICVVLILSAALAVLAWAVVFDETGAEAEAGEASAMQMLDRREAVSLNEEQLHFALTQMRGLLETMAELDEAEFADDGALIQQASATQAPGSPRPHPDGFRQALPKEFRGMSKQMRMGFKKMSAAAKQGDDQAYAAAKRQATNACIACHETYRFELKK